MQAVETNVKRIVREVAEECSLPLEIDKEETLHLRKSRKKKSADRRYVKWLGVIFDPLSGTTPPTMVSPRVGC